MRKMTALAFAAIFIGLSVGAYACGDKNNSAKADALKAEVKATQASIKVQDANVETAEYQGKANSRSASKEVKAKTADAMMKTTDTKIKTAGYSCPASTECPTPCDSKAKDIKAKTVDRSEITESVAMAPKAEEKTK